MSYTQVLQRVEAIQQQLSPATAPAPSAPTAAHGDFSTQLSAAGAKYGVDPSLLQAVMDQESGGDPNATSPAGAEGLMQLMPSTAAGLGVTDPYDPTQAIDGGAQLLSGLLRRYDGNTSLALAAYNAGSGAVDKFGGVPPYAETQRYVENVSAHYDALKGNA